MTAHLQQLHPATLEPGSEITEQVTVFQEPTIPHLCLPSYTPHWFRETKNNKGTGVFIAKDLLLVLVVGDFVTL